MTAFSILTFKTPAEKLKTYKSHTTAQIPAELIETRCQIPNFVLLKIGKFSWLIELTASFLGLIPRRGILYVRRLHLVFVT